MKARRSKYLGRRKAFTLVELLVVIGIIGVLLGILLPALGSMRERARSLQCQTNLRSLAQGFTLYTSNQGNGGVCPPSRMPRDLNSDSLYLLGEDVEYRPHWYNLCGAMLKQHPYRVLPKSQNVTMTVTNRLFLCPSIDWNNSRNFPYGYNYQFLGNTRPKTTTKGGKEFVNYPVKVTRIKARTVMAADCLGTAAGKPKIQRVGYQADGGKDPYAVGNKGWAMDPPRLTADSDYADSDYRNPQDRSAPDARHAKRVNVAFTDGSVQSMSMQELGYVVNPDGSVAANGAGTTNGLFSGDNTDKDPPSVR